MTLTKAFYYIAGGWALLSMSLTFSTMGVYFAYQVDELLHNTALGVADFLFGIAFQATSCLVAGFITGVVGMVSITKGLLWLLNKWMK